MSVSGWYDVEDDPRGVTFVRVLHDDAGGRYQAGEIGVLLENDYQEKYDAKVLLPPVTGPMTAEEVEMDGDPFLAMLMGMERIYFFYATELAYLRGPGYGQFRPGHTPRGRQPDRELQQVIAHDACAASE